MTVKSIVIRKPDDMHVHLRDGEMLDRVVKYTAQNFARALVMPNTTKPILTADDSINYRNEIWEACRVNGIERFEPLMTIKLTAQTTPETILRASRGGCVVAGKLYPEGVTTNSADGVRDVRTLFDVFATMQECGMVLCLHGETPGVFSLDREGAFLATADRIAGLFPNLRIVLEHITTEEAVKWLTQYATHLGSGFPNVAATITPHHLFLTLDDVIGDKLQPHNFCKPIAKRATDRDALIKAAISGNPKFFLGTDSAPHLIENKECASGCAGVFNAPVALPLLAEIFEKHDALDKLEDFTSTFGSNFYALPSTRDEIELERAESVIPMVYNGVAPFRAGMPISWAYSLR